MSPTDSKSEREKFEQAIRIQESLRGAVDDAIVDATIATLREKLATLEPAPRQRKQVTILFMDVVGSTDIIRDLDPEESAIIMDGALKKLSAPVEQLGGRVTRYMGDGFMAIFGAPVASENDPEMAVRAGLGILDEVGAINKELRGVDTIDGFSVRVGLSTGLVLAGGETEGEDTFTGAPVNLAARLESAAPPGGLLISQHTYRHVRGVFDVETQEPIQVKGFQEPVPIYLVKRAKPRAFRLSGRGIEGIETKMVGREAELRRLRRNYHRATAQRQTTVVTLVGDAGVGKSRLVHEFNNWLELQPDPIWYFKSQASLQTQGMPNHLLRELLGNRFQILDSDPLPALREKFVAGVGEFLVKEGEMKAHILGAWLGYDFGDSQHLRPIRDEPEQIKNQATLYLSQLFTAIGDQGAAIVLLEDIHWADGGSLDALIDLVRRRPELPLLIVCLARPSFYERRPEWDEALPAHTRLKLDALSSEASRALAAEILRQVDPLPQVLLDLVSSRAEGNPFYAEELVKMLIDEGVILTDMEVWRVAPEQLLELKVPATLTGVLQARLDRLLPLEKLALQQAAVIGHTFWDEALAALSAEGYQSLPALQAREFIFTRPESSFAGTKEFVFKHAILRDVTYETVLKRVRGQYHARVADWLVSAAEANGRGDEYAALIGEHYQLAGKVEAAAKWYSRAGRRAVSTYSNAEAIRYLTLALEFATDDDPAGRFAILKAREAANNIVGDRPAQQTDLEQLADLAGDLGPVETAEVALRLAHYFEATSDYPQAISHAQDAIEWGRRGGDKSLTAEGFWIWGSALYRLGQYPPAQEQLETGLQQAKAVGDHKIVANCLNGLGLVFYEQDDYASARANYEQALLIRREIRDRRGEGVSLNNLGVVSDEQGDYAAAKAYYELSLAIKREIGDRRGEGEALTNLGFMAWSQGDHAAGRVYHEQASVIFREIGDQRGIGVSLNNSGLVANDLGDYDAATACFEQSLEISREIGDRWGEGITLINLGEVALTLGDLALAENCYRLAQIVHQDLNQPHYLAEDWSGLARLKLAQRELDDAQRYAGQVLEYLKENPALNGAENPMRSFHFLWEVLVALGRSAAADEILTRAAKGMQDYAAKLDAKALQDMYLGQPHHAVLWATWTKKARG